MNLSFFLKKFEEMIETAKSENPHCLILMGDFNAHLKRWYGEIDDVFGNKFQDLFSRHQPCPVG